MTGFSEDDHITPQSYIARTKEEILKARSSKYCPVALNKIGNEIKESKGNFVYSRFAMSHSRISEKSHYR